MLVSKIFPQIEKNIDITGLSIDSREKNQGGIFFCIEGMTQDGHKYAAQAAENGAKVIVHSKELDKYFEKVEYVKVEDTVAELNRVTNIFYGFPSKDLTVYAVTGTNGKTTTSYIMESLLSHFEKAAYNGTIGTKINGKLQYEQHMTTPDNIKLTEMLAKVRDAGCTSIAMEISSHALAQGRADNVAVDVAIFTNLTHEHLDYHKTMGGYMEAKLRLFEHLEPSSTAIINIDDKYADNFVKASKCQVITYGEGENADYRITDVKLSPNATDFTLALKNGEKIKVHTNLVSKINTFNLTAAIIALRSQGYDINEILKYTDKISLNIGRFQSIENPYCHVLVDFAHTPDGFEKIFQFAQEITGEDDKIWSIFGSAGRRDVTKRPIFGELADKYCDKIILCEDDYRDEDPYEIALDILEGIEHKDKVEIIIDRYEAIKYAIDHANKDDIVLILSKGLERFLPSENGDKFWMGDDAAVIDICEKLGEKREK